MILLRLATLFLLLAAFFAVTGILACFAFGLAEAGLCWLRDRLRAGVR